MGNSIPRSRMRRKCGVSSCSLARRGAWNVIQLRLPPEILLQNSLACGSKQGDESSCAEPAERIHHGCGTAGARRAGEALLEEGCQAQAKRAQGPEAR